MKRYTAFIFIPLFIATLFSSVVICFAKNNVGELFNQGNEAYSRGDYDEAISSFSAIIETAGYSPSVLFNLANSYAQAGKTGKAILNYERAQRLAPADADIAGNLHLVRKERGLFPGEASGLDRFFGLLSLHQWALMALVSLAIPTILALLRMVLTRYRFSRQLIIWVSISSFFCTALSASGTVYLYQYYNPGVVVGGDGRLLVSPFATSDSVGSIQEGRLVYVEKTHNTFVYVTDETGRKGWLPTSMIEHVREVTDQ